MNNKYVIRWASRVNGRIGQGTRLFDREEAERLIEELNVDFPDIHHELAEPRQDVEKPVALEEILSE